jgi:hypothetical protein
MYSSRRTDIDFSFLIGQKVVEVNKDSNAVLVILFERGYLHVECSWRLRYKDRGILVAQSDVRFAKENFSYETVEQILQGMAITDVAVFEQIADLVIEFDRDVLLELFHDAAYFEGWQLAHAEDDNIHFWTDPGGELDYPLSNPLMKRND